ncbi:MAG: hypothetical protein J7M26_04585 [Armatimonadetes bacterium]|nr:hypothetical protein [Armatimonadota bacterium]
MVHLRVNRKRANSTIMVAMALPALVAAAAMTVDVGVMAMAKGQLQTAADAAALAGVAMLQTNLDPDSAAQAALEAASANKVLGEPVTLDPDVDIVMGAYPAETGEIVPFDDSGGVLAVPDGPVAVQVTVRRTQDSPDGPITLFFARALGLQQVNMRAVATAGLTVSHKQRPPVDAVIVQDQSGSFADEFPDARTGDVQFVDFMKQCYTDGDRTGIIGFGYHPYHAYSWHPTRRDTNVFHDYDLHSNEDTDEGAQQTEDYIASMPTVPYYHYPEKNCFTNLYTGMLKAVLAFAPPEVRQQAWDDFINSLYRSGYFKNIGWWRRNYYSTLKQKLEPLFNKGWENPDSEHVVVIVSDGMPWYHENGFPDWRSKDLCQYIADKMGDLGIRIHVVSLCQNDAPPDGSKGADAQFISSLCRNGGYAFYTYDSERLAALMTGVGQVEVGQAKLIK